MDINAQTLVLIDNSLSVSKVNREITKLTLKYLFTHSPEGRAYCFAPFAHELDYAESYTTDYIGLEDMAGRLEYTDKDVSITDTLTGILEKWQEGDYACRNILIITDGKQEAPIRYRDEELYYMLNNTSYPVYALLLEQEENDNARMDLSAICRISGGRLFSTEFEGSEAEVERQLSEQILAEMEAYEKANWAVYEETEDTLTSDDTDDGISGDENKDSDENEGSAEEELITESIMNDEALSDPYDEEIIYREETKDIFSDPLSMGIIGGSLFLAICACFLSWCFVIRRKKKNRDEEEALRRRIEEKMNEQMAKAEAAGGYRDAGDLGTDKDCRTVSLVRRQESLKSENATRLLNDEMGSVNLSFEDASDPSKYIRRTLSGRMRLGRSASLCDLVFDYDDSVSAAHCEITQSEGGVFVRDLNSSNGTYINGQKIYSLSELKDGDMLKLGLLSLIVRF